MGVANSKIDDDKALQLCRVRKKFVRQALDGRCALAATHVAFIQSLKVTGTSLRKFLQPEVPLESSLYTSTSATPEPLALTDKSVSHFSFSSPSASHIADVNEHLSPSSPTIPNQYQVHYMNFGGSSVKTVEEKPAVVATGAVTSLSTGTAQNTIPPSQERAEPSFYQPETLPWDYFGLFQPNDIHFSTDEQSEAVHGFRNDGDVNHYREEGEIPEVDSEDDTISCHDGLGSESENELEDPSSDTLGQGFKSLNQEESHAATDASPTLPKVGSAASVNELLKGGRVNSPKLSHLKTNSSDATIPNEIKMTPARDDHVEHKSADAKATPVKEDNIEHKIAPKDLFSSMGDVEYLFAKASESGKEVPRMLEANKLHFRPLSPGQEFGASKTSTLLKACFSCGEDPNQVQEEPNEASVKYLTWHRTMSSFSSSSRNPFGSISDDVGDLTSDLFENFHMISSSHASTLDRLFAWEKKLYDEVKASQVVRRMYDMKCKSLREQESRCENQNKIYKTRAAVKDLHSRIRVAIYRIDSISKKIEELRDKELQPQLEELIKGLWRMWQMMFECHKLQVHIITIAYCNGNAKLSVQSDSHRQIAAQLEDDLRNMASSFTKWINALKIYVHAINEWLHNCVSIPEKSSKKRKAGPSREQMLMNAGPPIYTTCWGWLKSLETLPIKQVTDTIKGLATEVSQFLPRQEKMSGTWRKTPEGADPELEMLTPHQAFEGWNTGYDEFRSSLVIFLGQMAGFAGCSVKVYSELLTNIEDAKRKYEHQMCQP